MVAPVIVALVVIGAYAVYKNRGVFYETTKYRRGYFIGPHPTYSYSFNTAEVPFNMTNNLKVFEENYSVTIIDRLIRNRVKVVPDASKETGYTGEGYAKREVKDTVIAKMPLKDFVKTNLEPLPPFTYGPVKDNAWEYGILNSVREGVVILAPPIGVDGPFYEKTSNLTVKAYYPIVGPNHRGWKN